MIPLETLSSIATKNAFDIACRLHSGQFRKDGITPYIQHPMKVAALLQQWGVCDETIYCAAYLHDVLEDCKNVDENEIITHCSQETLELVKILTKQPDESKDAYIQRVCECASIKALLIKASDRICNTRDFLETGEKDYARKYLHKADGVFHAITSLRHGTVFNSRFEETIDRCLAEFEKVCGEVV